MSESNTAPKFTKGLVTGAMVGAGLALLFAPKSGARLREQIGDSVESLRGELAARRRGVAASAGAAVDELKNKVGRTAEAVKSAARDEID